MSKQIYSDEREPFPMFGIEMGEGWKPIAQKVIDQIIEINESLPENSHIFIDQVKEKWATMRIYVTYDNVPKEIVNRVEKMIDDAETEAVATCEECGSKENIGMRINGWYTVMCEECAKKIAKETFPYTQMGVKWKRNSDKKVFIFKEDILKKEK